MFDFFRRAFLNVSSNGLLLRMHIHIVCTCLAFLHCVFSNVSSNHLPVSMHIHTGYISPLCLFKCLLKLLTCEDAKSHWLHLFDLITFLIVFVRIFTFASFKSNLCNQCDFACFRADSLRINLTKHQNHTKATSVILHDSRQAI